jgi:dinuclear metal center YbgI/SA1388 family protein
VHRIEREKLRAYLDELLDSPRFRDYCPNGLQVEGRDRVQRLVTGVTASQALLDAAIEHRADAVLVHHGYFWRGEDPRVTGTRKKRLASLLTHDISLFAYHLPLDSHPDFGNNAQFAKLCGVTPEGRFGEQEIAWRGSLQKSMPLAALGERIARLCQRAPLIIGDATREVHRIGWCSGGPQGDLEQEVELGLDAYISGEISEQTVHLARESGVAYIAAGHHATERLGVRALGEHLVGKFGLDVIFVDIDNPV